METVDTDELVEGWHKRIRELDRKAESIAERQDPMLKAEWDMVAERAAPEITRATLERCVEDLQASESLDELLAVMAQWRAEAEERNTGIREMSSTEFFRADRQRHRFEKSVEDLIEILPGELFDECPLCGAQKLPTSDGRYNRGFRWECPECHI